MSFDYLAPHPLKPDYMGYAEFPLNGHLIRAWQPSNSEAPREFIIEVHNQDGQLVLHRTVPMFYPNHFGVDVDDLAALNAATENIIKELKLE